MKFLLKIWTRLGKPEKNEEACINAKEATQKESREDAEAD